MALTAMQRKKAESLTVKGYKPAEISKLINADRKTIANYIGGRRKNGFLPYPEKGEKGEKGLKAEKCTKSLEQCAHCKNKCFEYKVAKELVKNNIFLCKSKDDVIVLEG